MHLLKDRNPSLGPLRQRNQEPNELHWLALSNRSKFICLGRCTHSLKIYTLKISPSIILNGGLLSLLSKDPLIATKQKNPTKIQFLGGPLKINTNLNFTIKGSLVCEGGILSNLPPEDPL